MDMKKLISTMINIDTDKKQLNESAIKECGTMPMEAEGMAAEGQPVETGDVAANFSLTAAGEGNVTSLLNIMKNAGLANAEPVTQDSMDMRSSMERYRSDVDEPEMSMDATGPEMDVDTSAFDDPDAGVSDQDSEVISMSSDDDQYNEENITEWSQEDAHELEMLHGKVQRFTNGSRSAGDQFEDYVDNKFDGIDSNSLLNDLATMNKDEQFAAIHDLVRDAERQSSDDDYTDDSMRKGEMGEEYSNEPDEEYQDHNYMTKQLSGGINRQKKQYAKAQDGDNAMAVETLRKTLSSALSEKKKKPKAVKEARESVINPEAIKDIMASPSFDEMKMKAIDLLKTSSTSRNKRMQLQMNVENTKNPPALEKLLWYTLLAGEGHSTVGSKYQKQFASTDNHRKTTEARKKKEVFSDEVVKKITTWKGSFDELKQHVLELIADSSTVDKKKAYWVNSIEGTTDQTDLVAKVLNIKLAGEQNAVIAGRKGYSNANYNKQFEDTDDYGSEALPVDNRKMWIALHLAVADRNAVKDAFDKNEIQFTTNGDETYQQKQGFEVNAAGDITSNFWGQSENIESMNQELQNWITSKVDFDNLEKFAVDADASDKDDDFDQRDIRR